jgi:O-antigen ligase
MIRTPLEGSAIGTGRATGASSLTFLTSHPLLRRTLPISIGLLGGIVFVVLATKLSPVMALGAVAGVVAAMVFLRNPTWSLYALAFVAPIERFGRISDDTSTFNISITRGLGMLALFVLLIDRLVRRKEIRLNPTLLLWSAFVATGLITLAYTSDLIPGVKIAGGYVGNILFLFVILNLALAPTPKETLRRVEICVLFWLAASIVVALYSIYDWHLGSGLTGGIPLGDVDPQAGAQLAKYRWSTIWEDRAELETLGGFAIRRSMGPTSHAAIFGINLIMTIPFFFYIIRTHAGRWLHATMWLGVIVSMYCVLLTNTRASLLLLVGVLGLCVLTGLVRVRVWMLLGALLLAAAVPFFIPVDIVRRIFDTQNYLPSKSAAMSVRIDYWGSGLRAFADQWLLGQGLANEHVVLEFLRNPIEGQSHVHNMFLQTLVDVGVIGWAIFMAFIASIVYACHHGRRLYRELDAPREFWFMTAAGILIIAVLVFGLQVDVFYFPLKGWWLIIGLMLVMGRLASQRAASAELTSDEPAMWRLNDERA